MPLLDLTIQATSRLGLEPIKSADGQYLFGGIIPAIITDFHVGTQKHTKGEFKDLDVPVLQVEFENFKLNKTDPDRFYTHSFKLVGTKQITQGTTDVYENRKPEEIDADTQTLWKSIKHFLESLTNSPNYRNIVNIPKADVIKYLDLPGIEAPADRIAKYETFFNYLVTFVTGDGKDVKSQIITVEGKPLPLWIKMLPNFDKDSKRNAKFYAISRFINQGVFEPMKVDKDVPVGLPKIIRIKATESLTLIAAATPGTPAGNAALNVPGKIDSAVADLLR